MDSPGVDCARTGHRAAADIPTSIKGDCKESGHVPVIPAKLFPMKTGSMNSGRGRAWIVLHRRRQIHAVAGMTGLLQFSPCGVPVQVAGLLFLNAGYRHSPVFTVNLSAEPPGHPGPH